MLKHLPDRERSAVLDIATMAREHGGRACIVGGAVRDSILGLESKDVDVEVFGMDPATLQNLLSSRFRLDLVGASFGVLKLHGLEIDVSLPRRESKSGRGHRAFEIKGDPALSLREASSRRDFTINAIYFDPLLGETIDPWNGVADLERRILRHVSPAFAEDPLRVLRGMQFCARFGLAAAPETIEICRGMTPENLPPERLFEEWSKLVVKGSAISKGLSFLRKTGWVRYYPELEKLIDCPQDPLWHPEGDVWNHTLLCLDAFAAHRTGNAAEDEIVGLAVLCHDFGKPACTKFIRGRYRSPGHDALGVEPTLSFLRRLTNEERLLKEIPPLVASHMQPFALWKNNSSDAAIRRLSLKVGRIDRLVRVCLADHLGRKGDWGPAPELEELERRAAALKVAACAPKPILMGRHLIELGYKPSAKFGEWLAKCFDAQLDGAFSDLDGALAYFETFAPAISKP